ncbi:1-deoxy-D-xylulose-5-phosphate reductoisomerase [Thermoclostridium stercorarium]|uniref:1-deoxy-D-xylulose-5-phosphate reductoisomerase n=1 Tax=Thermoclostridium stercorarium TaxID=1510 RepID=UPI002248E076|nr:1-deoxy-D-xylulose-5-phosphate reductoisomerase [Thermoclostridium stercorarium]UZQ84419.1 1-deoxy-D-xylulose-5-phosphate reductoisomerase [Thermoclostridium stercorarium]
MTKNLVILGSTGSIGTQALDVCDNINVRVLGLAAQKNIDKLEMQARKYKPAIVAVMDPERGKELKVRLRDTNIKVVWGMDGIIELVTFPGADTVLTSVVGIAGLVPTVRAIEAGKTIALANKETLVTAGKLVMEAAKRNNINILPVDSEHMAIFQCLAGNRKEDIEKLILTASGGPFRGYTEELLNDVTVEEALNHPTWLMGKKITIDSATMMNKGFEVIEARWLFDMELSKIEVLVHPQSIIHSMVSFRDGSIIAQLGASDMRIPIQLAMTWPERMENSFGRVDFTRVGMLTFEKPDLKVFKCLNFAIRAANIGGTMPAVLNAANEVAVSLFLDGKISFKAIMDLIGEVMENHRVHMNPSLNDIIEVDRLAREETLNIYKKKYKDHVRVFQWAYMGNN